MKAIQLQAAGKIELVEMAPPTVRDDQLLIRTGAAVLCTSDLNDIRENPFGIKLPVILGHEAAGTVERTGRAVKGFTAGDRVATHPVHPCGACDSCRGGTPHLCDDMGHFGVNMQGAFAEYFVVRQDRARRIPAGMDFAVAALAEPVCVCLEALEQARLKSGDSLLILGDGPFGVLIARLASGRELGRVAIAGHHDFRLAFASSAVRLNTANSPDARQMILDAGGGRGFDAVILATGNRQACREAVHYLRPKGRLVVFSAIPGETPIDLFRLHVKELELVGACNDQDRLDDAVRLLGEATYAFAGLITHRLPLERFREAVALAQSGREAAMKIALVFP